MTAKEKFVSICEKHNLRVLDVWVGYIVVIDYERGFNRAIRRCEIPEDGAEDLIMSWILEGIWS